jgi:succinyl-CoA synthetase beta subunit/citryl-CoA synthetase large subunit
VLTVNGASDYSAWEVAAALGYSGQTLLRLSVVIIALIARFIEWDALLLEVNPLILDANGEWCVADVHLELDDDAAFRQQAMLARLPFSSHEANRRSDFERYASEIDGADHRGVAGRLVQFDGDLGLLIGGGGASLTIMDAVLDAGLKPANYCEIGGNPSVWKIKELTKLILSQPGVNRLAVMMNVVSNTRVDLVARGVIKGALESGREPREVIVAFRIPGSWEEEGKAILHHYGVPFFDRDADLDQVVEAIRCRS